MSPFRSQMHLATACASIRVRLRPWLAAILLVATLTASPGFGQSPRADAPPPLASAKAPHVAGQLLVRYRSASSAGPDSSAPGLASARPPSLSATDKRLGLLGRRAVAFDRRPAASRPPLQRPLRPTAALAQSLEVLEFPAGADLDAAAKAYRADPNVVSVEPDYTFRLSLIPNDAFYAASQAADFALAGFPAAWDVATGQPGVLAAVLDQGVDTHHPELAGALDLAHGFNFLTQTADVDDSIRSHGTLVASIIGAAGNNGAGMAGGAYGVKILPLVVAAPDGSVATSDVIAALDYAVAQGAAVVNMSFSGSAQSATLAAAIAAAKSQTVIVAAVGNDAENQSARYPAAYPGVIGAAAAAKGSKSQRATFSNYNGPNTTMAAIAAPGESIFGAAPGGGFTIESGTSFAAPLVSAAAALLKSANPEQSAQAIAAHLEAHADPAGKSFTTYGFLDAAAALAAPMTPLIQISKVTVDDSKGLNAGNDGDGVLDRGETARVVVTLSSAAGDAINTTAGLTTTIPNDPQLNPSSLANASATFGLVANASPTSNANEPFGDLIVQGSGASSIDFNLAVWSGGSLIATLPFALPIQDEQTIPDGTFYFASQTWTSDKTYVVDGRLSVLQGLTIQPGTTVLMKEGSSIDILAGGLIADGTTTQPIQVVHKDATLFSPGALPRDWDYQIGGGSQVQSLSVCAAQDGSVYVVGFHYQTTAMFGSIPINGGYVAKFSPDGLLDWARRAGDLVYDAKVASDGSVVIAGYFSGSAVFGAGEPAETTLISSGGNDAFLARYSSEGDLIWARRAIGGAGSNEIQGLDLDSSDNIYVAGGYDTGDADFGPGDPNETILLEAGPQEGFIAKYSPSGILIWARRNGGQGQEQGADVACLPDGGAIVVGFFTSDLTLGVGEPGETSFTAQGSFDGYVAKYRSDGSLAWGKQIAGTNRQWPQRIKPYPDNSFAITGYYRGDTIFGPGETSEIVVNASASSDIECLARYDADGSPLWAKALGSEVLYCHGLCVRSDGSIVVTGLIDGDYARSYSADGDFLWARNDSPPGKPQEVVEVPNGVVAVGENGFIRKLSLPPDPWTITIEPTAAGSSASYASWMGGSLVNHAADTTISDCSFTFSQANGFLSTAGIGPIVRCTASFNGLSGIAAGARPVVDCTAEDNGDHGILTTAAIVHSRADRSVGVGMEGDTVTSSTASNNAGTGIVASSGSIASMAQFNAGDGIVIAAGDATGCSAQDNGGVGISMSGSGMALNCVVRRNGGGGMIAAGATIDSCVVEGNASYGIAGSGSSSVVRTSILNNAGMALSGVLSVSHSAIAGNGGGVSGASSLQADYIAGNQGAGAVGGSISDSAILGNSGNGATNPISIANSWLVDNSALGVSGNNLAAVVDSTISGNVNGGVQNLLSLQNSNLSDNAQFAARDTQPRSGFQTKNFENNYWGPALTAWMNINPFPADRDPEIVDGFDGAAGWFLDYSPVAASPVANAPDSTPPAFLLAVSPTVANPVGRGKAVFTLTFSKAMNTGIDPAVTFDLAPPFTRQIVSPDPGWTSPTTWVGSIWIDTDTGDGTNHLRVSGATAGDGFEIPADTLHAFAIDTSGHVVANNGIGTLSLYVNGDNEIDLSWTNNSSADLQSLDKRGAQLKGGFHLASANGFRVLRSLTKDGGFRQLNADLVENPSGLNDAEYFDTELAPGTTYYYRIDFQQLSGDSLEWTDVTSATTTGVMPPPAGALQTAINPQAAIAAGAQWRRVGASTWLDSAAIEDGIPTGDVAVEFKPVAGWIAPSNQSITINDGQTALVQGTYAIQPPPPPGSLQTAIAPQAAIDAGAQWRRTGTLTWLNSGAVESGLPAGPAAVEFKSIAGWVKPPAQPTTIISGQTTQLPATYFVRSAVEPRDWALYP